MVDPKVVVGLVGAGGVAAFIYSLSIRKKNPDQAALIQGAIGTIAALIGIGSWARTLRVEQELGLR